MDDIFYLSQTKLNVDSICALFQKADVIRVEKFKTSNTLQLYTKTQMLHLAIMEPFEFKDSADQRFIQEKKISSIICISHHTSYIAEILKLTELLLEKWGGWIGNDTDGFIPIFAVFFHEFIRQKAYWKLHGNLLQRL